MTGLTHAQALRCEIVQSANGETVPARQCDFVFPGGTLGRSQDNDMVLPDQRQQIASLQAIIHIAHSGQNQICNRGATAISLNGVSIERGQQRPIGSGDRLEIGTYLLLFSEAVAAHATRASADMPDGAQNDQQIPREIWAALDAEFAGADASPGPLLDTDPQHPLLQRMAAEHRPDNPLRLQGADADVDAAQSGTDLSGLFTDDDPLMQPEIMADTTPTVLTGAVYGAAASPLVRAVPFVINAPSHHANLRANLRANPLIDGPGLAEPDFDGSDSPLSLLLDTAVPLAAMVDDTAPSKRADAQIVAQIDAQIDALVDASALDLPAPLGRHHTTQSGPAAPPSPLFAEAAASREPDVNESLRLEPWLFPEVPAVVEPLALRDPYDPYDPESIIPIAADSPAGESGMPDATGQATDCRPTTSSLPQQVDPLLDGMGLNHAAGAHVGDEQVHLAGRLLRVFAHGMVRLLKTYGTTAGAVEAEAARDDAGERNPFFVTSSGDGVVSALFQQSRSGSTHAENAIDQAFAELECGLSRIAAGERTRVDALLQRLAPRQLELELETSGVRTAPEKSRRAALWEHFVQQHRRVAAETGHAVDQRFGDEHEPRHDAADGDASAGAQLVSASWRQHFGTARGNLDPSMQPTYAPHWGHRK